MVTYAMLTRAEVARRLRKSVATVRRLEDGGELRSKVDWRGIHLFDEHHVDKLAERFERGTPVAAAHSAWFNRSCRRPAPIGPEHQGSDKSIELDRLRDENARMRERLQVVRSAIDLLRDGARVSDVVEILEDV